MRGLQRESPGFCAVQNHHVTDGIDVAIVRYRDGYLVVFDCEGGNDPKAANHHAVPLLITLVGPKLLCTATNLLLSLLETLARIVAGRELIDLQGGGTGSSTARGSFFSGRASTQPADLESPLLQPGTVLQCSELLVLINKHTLQPFSQADLEACLVPDATTAELNSAREKIKQVFPARSIATLPYDVNLRKASASHATQRAWAAFVEQALPSTPLAVSGFSLDGPQLAMLLRNAVEQAISEWHCHRSGPDPGTSSSPPHTPAVSPIT